MKRIISSILLSILMASASLAAEKERAGPNGGRLLEFEPLAEFFVNEDRKIEVLFVDADLKPVGVETRTVRATSLAPSGRTLLEFEQKEDTLVSTQALPEGDGYTVVVQIFQTSDARPRNFRVVYQEHICGECELQEYACICGH